MPGMLQTSLRFMLALLMLAGYVPVPAKVAGLAGRREVGSCCAPKACCAAHGSACSEGGACGASAAKAGGSVLGAVLTGGACGMPVPRITPVSPDPTLAPRADVTAAPWAGVGSRVSVVALISSGITVDPSVPPPRA